MISTFICYLFTDGRTTADKYGCKYIETSAALNHRVDELLVGVLKQILLKANGGPVEETLPNHSAKSIKAKDKDRKGSFKKTKQFLEKIFRRSGTKDKACENLYVD